MCIDCKTDSFPKLKHFSNEIGGDINKCNFGYCQ